MSFQTSIQATVKSIDTYQQRHRLPAVIYGVLKKNGDDKGGYLAALITYYGFLSLFPLLLAVTSVLQIALSHHIPFAARVSVAVSNLLPFFGNDLTQNVHASTKTGISLIIGIVLSFFGARGVADALRHAINEAWHVPQNERPGFPGSIIKSLQVVSVGGGGFVISSVVGSFVHSLGDAIWFAVLANILSAAIIYLTLLGVFIIAKPKGLHRADMRRGALVTAIAFQALQLFGGYLLTKELHNLSATYGTFALVLGLLFYISIQAQIMIYAIEYNVVVRQKLWPRSLTNSPVTKEDKRAFTGLAQKEGIMADEKIKVSFKD